MSVIHQQRWQQRASVVAAGMTVIALAGWTAEVKAQDVEPPAVSQPVVENGVLTYPADAAIPKFATDIERQFSVDRSIPEPSALVLTTPPTGPVECPAEYEPMEGLIISWKGPNQWLDILAQIAFHVTNTADSGIMYVAVSSTSVQNSATSRMTSFGVNMSRVRFLTRNTDTIWIRDYGPRYIFEGNVRAMVDHIYNVPGRNNDNNFPVGFGSYKNHARYVLNLLHGGGNFHLDALDRGYATRLLVNENPNYTELQLAQLYQQYQNLAMQFFDPLPQNVDGTQHLDMWMQVIADDKVIISDWPNNPGSIQDNICEAAVPVMQSKGFTVYRTPAFLVGGVHYTYTNMVMFNNVVIIPSYTNSTVAPSNTPALTTIQQALPGKTVVQVPCENIVDASGVMHCIVMHVPANRGGEVPTVFLKSPRTNATFNGGSTVTVTWIDDDDLAVTGNDILFSADGGATWPYTLATNTAPDGTQNVALPFIGTTQGKIRVVARDASGNAASDESTGLITLNQPPALVANTGLTLDEGTTATITTAALEVTAGTTAPSGITYTITRLPVHGSLQVAGSTLSLGGTFTQQQINDGVVSYTHSGSETLADDWQFTFRNAIFAASPVQTFQLSINAINDAPTAITLSPAEIAENSPAATVVGVLSAVDADDDASALSFSLIGDATAFEIVAPSSLAVAAGATLDFETTPSVEISVQVQDAAGATFVQTFTVSITNVRELPAAVDDVFDVGLGEQVLNVLQNDTVGDAPPLTISAVSLPSRGSATIEGTSICYVPDTLFNEVVTFTYTISDGQAATDTASVTLNVGLAGEPVALQADSFSVEIGTVSPLNVLLNDSAIATGLGIVAVTPSTLGTVALSNGQLTYTAPQTIGVDTFSYTVATAAGRLSTAQVTVTIVEPPAIGCGGCGNGLPLLAPLALLLLWARRQSRR